MTTTQAYLISGTTSKFERALQSHGLTDTCLSRFDDSLIKAFARALDSGESIELPLSIHFDKWSKAGTIVCNGQSLNHQHEDDLEFTHGIGYMKVSPSGSLAFEPTEKVTESIRIELATQIQKHEVLFQSFKNEYFEDCQIAKDLASVSGEQVTLPTAQQSLEERLTGETSSFCRSFMSPARTKRIVELITGQLAVCLSRINTTVLDSHIREDYSHEAAMDDVRNICGDFADYWSSLKNKLTSRNPNSSEGLGESVERKTINDFVQSEPVMRIAESLGKTFRDAHLAEEDIFELTLHQRIREGVSTFTEYALHIGNRSQDLRTFIAAHQKSQLSEGHYRVFSELCQELVMDFTKPLGEREGFGVLLTEDKVKTMLEPASTVVFTSHSGWDVAGVCVLYTTTEMLSDEEQQLVNEYCEKEGIDRKTTGYMYLVGTSPKVRTQFSEHGDSIYSQIMDSQREFCSLFGISHILCEVWEDNAALPKHLRKGWELTGIDRTQVRGEESFLRKQLVYLVPPTEGVEEVKFSSMVQLEFEYRAEGVIGKP